MRERDFHTATAVGEDKIIVFGGRCKYTLLLVNLSLFMHKTSATYVHELSHMPDFCVCGEGVCDSKTF